MSAKEKESKKDNESIERLHYLRTVFALQQGITYTSLPTFMRATEVIYNNRSFFIDGDNFVTWGYLTPDREINYIEGKFDWLDDISTGRLWVFEADLKVGIREFKRKIKLPENQTSFLAITGGRLRRINL